MAGNTDLDFLAEAFQIPGDHLSTEPYGSGHINETFLSTFEHAGQRARYIQQKLNTTVFPDPVALMENVSRVVDHLASSDPGFVPQLVPAFDGRAYYLHDRTEYWRTFNYIEGARSLDIPETSDHARQAAAAFGRFQLALADLPAPHLHETIADFHNTAKRVEQLLDAIDSDNAHRARHCRDEIEFARSRASLASALTNQLDSGAIPERIAHNDTKLNNVLLDAETGEGVCVIDLDTVMPGSVLYDFGDMLRTATMEVPEDEPDLSRVRMDEELFRAVVEGYLGVTSRWLNDAEKAALVLSGRVVTFEIGVRFLTDFLNGDSYFRTTYADHNLIRCRTQFALLRNMEAESDRMEDIVRRTIQ